jgi:hypothetical protein
MINDHRRSGRHGPAQALRPVMICSSDAGGALVVGLEPLDRLGPFYQECRTQRDDEFSCGPMFHGRKGRDNEIFTNEHLELRLIGGVRYADKRRSRPSIDHDYAETGRWLGRMVERIQVTSCATARLHNFIADW